MKLLAFLIIPLLSLIHTESVTLRNDMSALEDWTLREQLDWMYVLNGLANKLLAENVITRRMVFKGYEGVFDITQMLQSVLEYTKHVSNLRSLLVNGDNNWASDEQAIVTTAMNVIKNQVGTFRLILTMNTSLSTLLKEIEIWTKDEDTKYVTDEIPYLWFKKNGLEGTILSKATLADVRKQVELISNYEKTISELTMHWVPVYLQNHMPAMFLKMKWIQAVNDGFKVNKKIKEEVIHTLNTLYGGKGHQILQAFHQVGDISVGLLRAIGLTEVDLSEEEKEVAVIEFVREVANRGLDTVIEEFEELEGGLYMMQRILLWGIVDEKWTETVSSVLREESINKLTESVRNDLIKRLEAIACSDGPIKTILTISRELQPSLSWKFNPSKNSPILPIFAAIGAGNSQPHEGTGGPVSGSGNIGTQANGAYGQQPNGSSLPLVPFYAGRSSNAPASVPDVGGETLENESEDCDYQGEDGDYPEDIVSDESKTSSDKKSHNLTKETDKSGNTQTTQLGGCHSSEKKRPRKGNTRRVSKTDSTNSKAQSSFNLLHGVAILPYFVLLA
ncbi:hypothetical protein BgAZ_209230 [Babesia gibsoni]|uniref:Uncharacterized protein n=1 Tax=Babesia gibsoni TaxID=33632 RepID=A0AAD8PEV8_BABGI|nr:hypothetical protein BgAZ_209230 [Babesia gibsoni]